MDDDVDSVVVEYDDFLKVLHDTWTNSIRDEVTERTLRSINIRKTINVSKVNNRTTCIICMLKYYVFLGVQILWL